MDLELSTTKFAHHPDSVPAELKVGEYWVTCDKYKVPLIALPSGTVFAASSTNADTWRSYEIAFASYSENEHITGIGRVISCAEDYVGVDLDDCVDPKTGELSSWASMIVDQLNSYAEISPSRTGIKIWTKAPSVTRSYKKPELEVYTGRRYFTVTGFVIGHLRPIRDVSAELVEILDEEFPKVNRARAARGEYDGPDRVFDLDALLERAEVEIFTVAPDDTAEVKYLIRCPWHQEHSNGDDSGTRVGRYPDGALFFVCEHAHCGHRAWSTFRHYLETLIYLGRPPRAEKGRLR